MGKSAAKYVQVKFSPQLKKEFVQLCQRITDEIDREKRQMNIGPMATYAACYLLTLSDDDAIQIVREGMAKCDANPIAEAKGKGEDEPKSHGPVFKGHDGVHPTKRLPNKVDGRTKRRPKGNQTRARSVD